MDYQRLNNQRMTGTKISPYDMITAVTQRTINKQLEKMHQVNESLQKLSLLSANPEDDYSRLDANLTAPTIELRLGKDNRNVIFCLKIASATLKYLRPRGRKLPPSEESLEIPACILAVSVDLNFEGVDFTNLPKHVQDRLKVKNNYSVQQLLLDFTSASLVRLDKRRTTVHGHIEDLTAKAFFNNFIEEYFIVLGEKNEFVLHYVPLANEDYRKKYEMPTVPPTDFTFQNMPFIQNDKGDSGPSEDNMLVYLQMCDGHPMPKDPLSVSENWVVPTPNDADRYDGTVVLSADSFLNGWLLKKLSDFNRNSTWIIADVRIELEGDTTLFYMGGSIGRKDASENDLKWNAISSDSSVSQDAKNLVNGGIGQWYEYSDVNSVGVKSVDEIDVNSVGVQPMSRIRSVTEKATTKNFLFIPEGYNNKGKCEIVLYGNTTVTFGYSYHGFIDLGMDAWVSGEWSTRIVLDGVNDGELIIKADDIKPKITNGVNKTGQNRWETKLTMDYMERGLKDLSMTYIIDEMRSVLKNSWDFVLPGGADFYISKAAFNREKDLICELKYKFHA